MAIGCQIASPCLVLVITARFARVRRSETRHGLCLPACIAYQDHQHHYATVPRPVWRSDAVQKILFPFGCTEANGLVGFSVACSVACLAASLFSVWLGSYSVGYLVTSFALWLVSTCLVG